MGTDYMRNTAEGAREFKIVSNGFFHTKNRKMEVTRKSCSETNTKAALRYRSTIILKLFAPKRSLADIAEHICQIRRRSAGNFFPKRVNKYSFVSGPSN